jgi:hypothetical protein
MNGLGRFHHFDNLLGVDHHALIAEYNPQFCSGDSLIDGFDFRVDDMAGTKPHLNVHPPRVFDVSHIP